MDFVPNIDSSSLKLGESKMLSQRIHFFELMDQTWWPHLLRQCMTEYLSFVANKANLFASSAIRLNAALKKTNSHSLVDLCAGDGGLWISVQPQLSADTKVSKILLTDLHPSFTAENVTVTGLTVFEYVREPVDALQVPSHLSGFRTLWNGFHHFTETQAVQILRDAVAARTGIAIFEGTRRDIPSVLAMILIVPLIVLFVTPLIRPFRLGRLLFTYLIPVLPLAIGFDGIVSCLRVYSPDELRKLVAMADAVGQYDWEIGEDKVEKHPATITYLIGTPKG